MEYHFYLLLYVLLLLYFMIVLTLQYLFLPEQKIKDQVSYQIIKQKEHFSFSFFKGMKREHCEEMG